MMTPDVKKLREVGNETGSAQQLTPGLKLLDGTPILPGTALKGIRELRRTPPKIHNMLRPTSTEEVPNCGLEDDINASSGINKDLWYVNIKTPIVQLPNEQKGVDPLDFALVKDGKFPTGRALERSPVRFSNAHELFDGHVPESPLEVREVIIEPGSRIPRTPLHSSSGRPSAACDLVIHYSRNRISGAGEKQVVSNEDKENVKKVKPRKRSMSSNNVVPSPLDNSSLSGPADEVNIFKPKTKLARTPIKQHSSVVPVISLSVVPESKSSSLLNENLENNQIIGYSPQSCSKEITESLLPPKIEAYEHVVEDGSIFQRSKKLSRTPVKGFDSSHEKLIAGADHSDAQSNKEATSKLEVNEDISADKPIFQRSTKLARTPVKGGDSTNANLLLVSQTSIQNSGDASNSFNNQQINMESDANNSNVNENPLHRNKVIKSPANHEIAEQTLDNNSVTALVPLIPSVNSLKPQKNIIPKGKQLMRTPPSGKFQRQEGDGNSVAPSLSTVEECPAEDPTAIFMAQLRNNEPLQNKAVRKKPFLKSNKSKIVLNNNQLKKSKSSNKLDLHTHSSEKTEFEIDSKKNEAPKSVLSAMTKDRRLTYKVSDECDENVKVPGCLNDHNPSKSVNEKVQDAVIIKSRKLTYVVQHEKLTNMEPRNEVPKTNLFSDKINNSNTDIKCLKQTFEKNTGSREDSIQESDNSLLCLDELCDKSLNLCDDLFEEAMERKKSLNVNAIDGCSTNTNMISISYCLTSPVKSELLSSIDVCKIKVGDTPSQSNEPINNVMNNTFDVIANSDSDEDFFDASEEIPKAAEPAEKLESSSIPMNSTFEISKSPPKGANSTFDIETNPNDTFSMLECTDGDETENKNATFNVEPTQETPEIRVLNDTFDMDIGEDTNINQILNSTYDENSKLDKPHINMELDSPNKTLENTASTVIENITPNKTVEDQNESSTKDNSVLDNSVGKKSDYLDKSDSTSSKASSMSENGDSDMEDDTRPRKNNRRGGNIKSDEALKECSDKNTERRRRNGKNRELKLSSASDKCDDIEDEICKPTNKSSRKKTNTKKAGTSIVNSTELLKEESVITKDEGNPQIESKEMEELYEQDSENNEENIKPMRVRGRKVKVLKSSDSEDSGDLAVTHVNGHKNDDTEAPKENKREDDEKNSNSQDDRGYRKTKNDKANAVSSDNSFEKIEEKPKQKRGRKVKKKPIKECPPSENDAAVDENNLKVKENNIILTEDIDVLDDEEASKSDKNQKSEPSTADENDCEENLGKEKNKHTNIKTRKKIDEKEEPNYDLSEQMEEDKRLPIQRPTRRQPRRNRKTVNYTETLSPLQTECRSRSIVNKVDKVKSITENMEDICGENKTLDATTREDEHQKDKKSETLPKRNRKIPSYRDKGLSSDCEPEKRIEKLEIHELTREANALIEKPASDSTIAQTDKSEIEQGMEVKASQEIGNLTKMDDREDKPSTENASAKMDDDTKTDNDQKVTRRKPAPRSKLLSIRASFGIVKNSGLENKQKRNVSESGGEKEIIPDSNEKEVSDIIEKLNEVNIEDAASKLAKPKKVGKPGRKPKVKNTEDSPLEEAKTTLQSVGRRVLSRCKKFTGSYDETNTVDEKNKRIPKSTPVANLKENVCSKNSPSEDHKITNKSTPDLELGINRLSSGLLSGHCMRLPRKSTKAEKGTPKITPEKPSLNLENVFITETNVNGNSEGVKNGELLSEWNNDVEIRQEPSVPCQQTDNNDVEKSKKEKKIKRLSGIPIGLGNQKTTKDVPVEDATIANINTPQEKLGKASKPTKSKLTSTKTLPTKIDALKKSFGLTANKSAVRISSGSSESSSRSSLPGDRKISSTSTDVNKKPATVAPVKSIGVRGVKQGKIAGVALKGLLTTENTNESKTRVVNQKVKTSSKMAVNSAKEPHLKEATTLASNAKTKRALKKEVTKSSANDDEDKVASLMGRRKKVPVKKGVRNPINESPSVSVSDSDFIDIMPDSRVQNPKPRKRQKKDDKIPAVESEEILCTKTSDEPVPTVELLQNINSAMEIDKETNRTEFSASSHEVNPPTAEYRNPEPYNEDESVQDENEKTTKKVKRLSFIPVCRGAVSKAKTTEDKSGKIKDLDKAVEGINTLQITSPVKATRAVRKPRTTKLQKVENQESTETNPEEKETVPKKRGRKKKGETSEVTDVEVAVLDIIEDKVERKGKGKTSAEDQIHEIEEQLEQLNARKDVSPQTDLQISQLEAKLVKLQDKLDASKTKQTVTRSLRSTRLKKI